MIAIYVLFGALGYALASFTHRDEAKFWKERADYWYENSTAWMETALSLYEDRASSPDKPNESRSAR